MRVNILQIPVTANKHDFRGRWADKDGSYQKLNKSGIKAIIRWNKQDLERESSYGSDDQTAGKAIVKIRDLRRQGISEVKNDMRIEIDSTQYDIKEGREISFFKGKHKYVVIDFVEIDGESGEVVEV